MPIFIVKRSRLVGFWTGRLVMNRTSEIRTIRKPEVFSSGSPNRTSGFRTSTVIVFDSMYYISTLFVLVLFSLTFVLYRWENSNGGDSNPSCHTSRKDISATPHTPGQSSHLHSTVAYYSRFHGKIHATVRSGIDSKTACSADTGTTGRSSSVVEFLEEAYKK